MKTLATARALHKPATSLPGVAGFPLNSGQSLIQVLVVVAIMSVVAVGIASMITWQNRELAATTQKLAVTDLQKVLIASMADGSVCQYLLNNPNAVTFDSKAKLPLTVDPTKFGNPAFKLFSSVNQGPPVTLGPVIAEVGRTASAFTDSVIVESIRLQIVSGSGTSYLANWVVDFNTKRLVRAIHPATVSTLLTVDPTNPSAVKITGCQSPPAGGSDDFIIWF